MTMNKTEQKQMADLEQAVRLAKAMRWPDYRKPAPMTHAEIKSNLVEGAERWSGHGKQMVARGWFGNSYREIGAVSYGCSDGLNHNSDGDGTRTQGMGTMFATELQAWQAVRHEMTERFAKALADVDAKVAALMDRDR